MADVPVTVRPLHRGDNYAADLDLNQRAFGPSDPAGNEQRLASVRVRVSGPFDTEHVHLALFL